MKNHLAPVRVALAALALAACGVAHAQLNIHVATNGNDSWSGMLSAPNSNGTDGPKRTLAGGRDALRKIKAGQSPGGVVTATDVSNAKRLLTGKGAVVNIGSGTYDAKTPTLFDSRDSAPSSRAPIVYKASTSRAAVLDAGFTVTNLTKASGAFWTSETRVDPAVRSLVYVADLSGVSDLGKLTFRMPGWNAVWSDVSFRQIPNYNQAAELVIDNKPMTLAQWPNLDAVDMNGQGGFPRLHNGYTFITGEGPSNSYTDPSSSNWVYELKANLTGAKTPASVGPNSDIWLRGCMGESRFKEYWEHLTSIDYSFGQSSALLRFDPVTPFYQSNGGRQVDSSGDAGRFSIVNSLYELDAPGEYYIDRTNKRLLVIPPPSFVAGSSKVKLTMNQQPVIQATGLRSVTFDGLTIQNGRFMGAYFKDCYGVSLKNSTVQNVGHNGVTIDNSYRTNVQSCMITETGQGAVDVQSGDRATLTPSGNLVSDNAISHWGRTMKFFTGAIRFDGCGNTALNNSITDGQGEGVIFRGNDQLIKGNYFARVATDTGDSAVCVTNHDVTAYGNVITGNYFKDTYSLPYGRWPVSVLFMDGAAGSVTFDNNIVVNADRAINVLSTYDINIRNNAFVNCSGYAVRASSVAFAPSGTYLTRANQVPWSSSLWASRYPHLKEWLTTLAPGPRYYNISNNIYLNCTVGLADQVSWPVVFGVGGYNAYNVNQSSSPFVDVANGNFALRADKQSLVPNWQPMTSSTIGSRTMPQDTGTY